MVKYIPEIVMGAVISLTVLSFFWNKSWLRILNVFFLTAFLLLREYSIVWYVRSGVDDLVASGQVTESNYDGMLILLDFCRETSFLVYVGIVVFLAMCLHGIGSTKQKRSDKSRAKLK